MLDVVKKKLILFLSLFIYITLGLITLIHPQSEYEDFMPLSLGNRWVYGYTQVGEKDELKDEYAEEVVAIDTINDIKYFRIKVSKIGKDSRTLYFYHKRTSCDTLFALYFDDETGQYTEIIDAIFSMNVGEVFYVKNKDDSSKGCMRKISVKKKSESNIELFLSNTCVIDAEELIVYKKGIGIVLKSYTWGGQTKLLDYSIN